MEIFLISKLDRSITHIDIRAGVKAVSFVLVSHIETEHLISEVKDFKNLA